MYYQYDDILNVFGYLQSRNETLDQAFARLARGVEDLDVRLDKLDGDIADVKSETDDLLARAFALAKSMGIDVSDLEEKPKSLSLVPAKKEEPLLTDRKIILPPDIDYRAEFEKLVDQAHAAGFTAVQPTDVLTAEELRRADAVSRQLDEAFSSATRLKGKDLAVLWIAVALRVIIYFMYHKFRAAVPDVPLSADAPQSQEIAPKGKKKLLSREVKEKANEVKDTADNLIQVLILGKGIMGTERPCDVLDPHVLASFAMSVG